VDTAAQILKAFLRELSVPVFPFESFDALLAITDKLNRGLLSRAEWRTELLRIQAELPWPHKETLQFVLGFLADVTRLSASNKVTPENICLLFGPSLMRARVDVAERVLEDMRCSQMSLNELLLDALYGDILRSQGGSTEDSAAAGDQPTSAMDVLSGIDSSMLARFSNTRGAR